MKKIMIIISRWRFLFLFMVIGMAAITSAGVSAVVTDTKSDIKQVKGTFTLRFFPPGSGECGSHDGACLTGTATGDLSGEVFIRVFNSHRVVGSARTVSVSNADIRITRHDGQLDGGAAGSLDLSSGEFANVTSWVGGTGRYQDATGYVRVYGMDDLTTGVEHSTYKGTPILPKSK